MATIDTASPLAIPASQAAGAATFVGVFGVGFTVFAISIGSGTYQLQISPDNVAWQNEGSALTADGNVAVIKQCAWVRWNCTAYSSGTPTSKIAGARF